MRCSHLTGTTTKNVLRCLQFFLPEKLGDKVEDFINVIGFKMQQKDVTRMTSTGIKKAYK